MSPGFPEASVRQIYAEMKGHNTGHDKRAALLAALSPSIAIGGRASGCAQRAGARPRIEPPGAAWWKPGAPTMTACEFRAFLDRLDEIRSR